MSLFGARKTIRVGPLRFTLSASGLNTSIGSKRARVGVNSRGRKRASANLGGGLRWTKSRR